MEPTNLLHLCPLLGGKAGRRKGFYLSEDEAVEGYMAYRANHQADVPEDLRLPSDIS